MRRLARADVSLIGMPDPRHHIIITGTGRAGTTFLVQLLSELGFDTGYASAPSGAAYFKHCSAGFEHPDPAAPGAPYILKNPDYCTTLQALLDGGRVCIDHAIIPVRDLRDAALSRARVGGDGTVPGGLVGTADPARQEAVLAERFHGLVHTLLSNDIPLTFLLFPRFARDPDYTFDRLRWLLGNTTRKHFFEAFSRISRPGLIHDFSHATAREPDGEPAKAFAASLRQRRLCRRAARILAAAGLTAAACGATAWLRPVRTDAVAVRLAGPRSHAERQWTRDFRSRRPYGVWQPEWSPDAGSRPALRKDLTK